MDSEELEEAITEAVEVEVSVEEVEVSEVVHLAAVDMEAALD